MPILVTINVKREFEVNSPYDKVFDTLANVPVSVSYFPKVDRLEDMGDGVFKWEMDKVGVDKYSIQTVYACKYISDKAAGWVKWEPVKGVGNALVNGEWNIKSLEAGKTKINFASKGDLTIPLPGLLKFIIAPVVSMEFESLIDKYHKNLKEFFNK